MSLTNSLLFKVCIYENRPRPVAQRRHKVAIRTSKQSDNRQHRLRRLQRAVNQQLGAAQRTHRSQQAHSLSS